MLEAFDFAKREVGVAYEREGIMSTEHPILSDNGEKTGTQTPTADGKQGRVASVLTLGRAAAKPCRPIRSCARSTSSAAISSGGSKR